MICITYVDHIMDHTWIIYGSCPQGLVGQNCQKISKNIKNHFSPVLLHPQISCFPCALANTEIMFPLCSCKHKNHVSSVLLQTQKSCFPCAPVNTKIHASQVLLQTQKSCFPCALASTKII